MRGELDQDITVKPRDFINIGQAGNFYVAGEVKEPGGFPITMEGISVRQAIALAKGTKYEGNLTKSVIFRQNDKGGRDKIDINIAAIMKGEAEDIAILTNDIVVVPNSKSKAIAKSVLQVLTGSIPYLISRVKIP